LTFSVTTFNFSPAGLPDSSIVIDAFKHLKTKLGTSKTSLYKSQDKTKSYPLPCLLAFFLCLLHANFLSQNFLHTLVTEAASSCLVIEIQL
jgi:hypothetical protein